MAVVYQGNVIIRKKMKSKDIIITKNFDRKKVVGKAKLLSNIIIPYNSVFAIGGRILEQKGNKITKFELLEISLISDTNYKKFLER